MRIPILAALLAAASVAGAREYPVEWIFTARATEIASSAPERLPLAVGDTFPGRYYWDPRDPFLLSEVPDLPCGEIRSWIRVAVPGGFYEWSSCMGVEVIDETGIGLESAVYFFAPSWEIGASVHFGGYLEFDAEHYITAEIVELEEREHNPFRRGDCNADGEIDISDPLRALLHLFAGRSAPECPDACDANDDGAIDIADPIATLARLFQGGPEPSAPYRECGEDPTRDELGCGGYGCR